MIVSVGDVQARCRDCGGTDFTPAQPGELELGSVLKCSGCGKASSYEALLDDIGEEAMKRANESLSHLKERRGPRKPKK